MSDSELLAVCCDARRSGVDAGLSLGELARLYSQQDQPAPESRPVVTALLFESKR